MPFYFEDEELVLLKLTDVFYSARDLRLGTGIAGIISIGWDVEVNSPIPIP